VTTKTGTSPAPETKSPGVAEVSAFACVVSTAVIHNGAVSPQAFAARPPITVSRDIADAGTGEPALASDPALAGDPAQPAPASPDAMARAHASAAAARASGRAAVSGCVGSSAFMPVGRSPHPARLHAAGLTASRRAARGDPGCPCGRQPDDHLDRLAAYGGVPGSGLSAYSADAGSASSVPIVWARARIWPYIRRWSSLSRSSSCGCCVSPACSR
jgi:hypothetical protein